MNIPSDVINIINKNSGPLNNNYLIHAKNALEVLNKVTKDTYCYDHMSMVINTLERYYKGFLKASTDICDWYNLPDEEFLAVGHNLLKLVVEIKHSFSNVLPRTNWEEWQKTKDFLRDLRLEYTNSRYNTCPSYEEFKTVLEYKNDQKSRLMEYLNNKVLETSKEVETDIDEDESDLE